MFGVLFIIILAFGFIGYSYLYAGCDITLEYQTGKLHDHISSKGLDLKYLSFDAQGSTECKPSFIYKSETEHIHFVLVDGGKITSWDYNIR